MTTDELLKHVAEQPIITVQRMVSVPGPALDVLLRQGRPMTVAELIAHPDQQRELRTFRYAHILEPRIPIGEISLWQAKHASHQLPQDLMQFLTCVNGIHLWADLETSRSYFGILPLSEWQNVADSDWAMMFESPPAGQLVISYHENGDYFLVLDTHERRYIWYDPQNLDHPKVVGTNIAELLDFWWRETEWLDPRRTKTTPSSP